MSFSEKYLEGIGFFPIFAAVYNYIRLYMEKDLHKNVVNDAAIAHTYGMSDELRDSGLLSTISGLSSQDKACLIRFIHETENPNLDNFEEINDDMQPYTMEELNARIDETEAEIDRGEGKSFEEMMNGFREQLLWLK